MYIKNPYINDSLGDAKHMKERIYEWMNEFSSNVNYDYGA